MIQQISTSNAPAAIGPYSQAIRAGSTVYVSGQLPVNPATASLAADDVEAQTEQSLRNVEAILLAAGFSMADVVKTTVLLASMEDFAAMNAVYARHFAAPYPARAAFQVAKLPLGARVEIEAVAVKTEEE